MPVKILVYTASRRLYISKLHASDLRALAPSSTIATRLLDSPSSVQLPYVLPAPGADSIHHIADKLAQLCGAQRFNLPIVAANSAATETFDSGAKHVLCLSMPAVTESAGARKRSVVEHGAHLLASPLQYTCYDMKTDPDHVPRSPSCD